MSIKDKWRKKLLSQNNKNFLLLFSGSTVAQAIPLLASVVLARIYTPEDFGILALFNAIVLILSSTASLRYELAIVLPNRQKDAVAITFLSAIIAFIFSLTSFFIILCFKEQILHVFGAEKLGNWVYLVPLSILLNAWYSILNYVSLRDKKYKNISYSNVVRGLSKSLLQIGLGLLNFFREGLIIGDILSITTGNMRMAKHFYSFKRMFRFVTWRQIKLNMIRYKDFPLISSWGMLLNTLSLNANNFFISKLYGIHELGFYSYSYRYLNVPLSLISTNMGQLFYQLCADCHKNNSSAIIPFFSTLKKLLIICVPIFTLLYFLVEDVFALVFGEVWRIAGTYAKFLLPLFMVRTIFGPLSLICLAFERQKLNLLIQLGLFAANISGFIIAYLLNYQIEQFLNVYMALGLVTYSCALFLLYLIAGKKM